MSDNRSDEQQATGLGESEPNDASVEATVHGHAAKEAADGRATPQEVGQFGESAENEPKEPRKWEPNRAPRKVRSKKYYDKKKVESLAEAEERIYKGELDEHRRDQKRPPRSVSRSEAKVRAKAAELAENDPVVASMRERKITDFRSFYEPCKASAGRLGALYATQQVRRRNAFAQEIIESTIDRSRLNQADRAFATLLTLGVVSTQGALDEVINRCLASPRDIKPDVRDALRISTYEVIYLRKTPHAAVDQGVELVRAVAPSASGLGNAVLHRILACSETFPFGDPSKNLEALALACAFPTWLARTLVEDMGAKAAADLMSASNDPAPLFIHVNALKATDEEVIQLFGETGAELTPEGAGGVQVPGCYRVSNSRSLADGRIRRLFQQGKVLVSDAAAQAVAYLVVNEDPGELLEVGAGRGTKTIMMQSLAYRIRSRQQKLTSLDSHSFKSDLLRERAKTYDVNIDDVVTGNATRLEAIMPERLFDTVFIDAPCSGLGTLRRHHEIRWRIEPERIDELAQTGLDMLRSAAGHVNPGGRIVYATCTVTYAENNGVVKRFLASEEGSRFKLVPLNGKDCFSSELRKDTPDAHFAVAFQRQA